MYVIDSSAFVYDNTLVLVVTSLFPLLNEVVIEDVYLKLNGSIVSVSGYVQLCEEGHICLYSNLTTSDTEIVQANQTLHALDIMEEPSLKKVDRIE